MSQAAAPAAKPAAAPAPQQSAALTEEETREHAWEILSELLGLGGRPKGSLDGAVDLLKVCTLARVSLRCSCYEVDLSLTMVLGLRSRARVGIQGQGQGHGQPIGDARNVVNGKVVASTKGRRPVSESVRCPVLASASGGNPPCRLPSQYGDAPRVRSGPAIHEATCKSFPRKRSR